MTEVDPQLVAYYKVGLVIGILILSTLSLFPGKPLGIEYGKEHISEGEQSTPSREIKDPREHPVRNSLNNLGDVGIRPWRINYVVYTFLTITSLLIIDHAYHGVLSFWLSVYFPKEAGTLGFSLPAGT